MGAIVCATRGGQGSRAAQVEAVRRAREQQVPLIFLYVVDTNIVGEYAENLVTAVRAEFRWLGQALLRIARQRAEQAGVDAEMVIVEGEVKAEIEKFLRERGASCLLLGAPQASTPDVFGDDAIEQFAQMIQQDTGVSVDIIHAQPSS